MHYLLTLDFPPPYNIGERVLASNIAKVLSRIPLSNLTILCRANHTSDYNLVYVQRTGNEYVDSARIAIRFKKICEEGEYAIVHLININYSVALPIIKALMKTHLSLIIYFYLLEHYSYLNGFKKILKCLVAPRFCSNFADIAIGTSPLIVRYLSMLGFKQIRYIPPPVDCDLFKPINKLKAQQVLSSKFNMNIKEDSFILLYMGHLTPTRFPYASIMKAIKETIRDGISIQFLIFAPRFWYNEVHARKIRILSEFMNLKEHVNIHIQDIDETEKPFIYNAADVFLFPALKPTAIDPPLTVLEAMACGLPVVASNIQSVPYIIKSGKNGFLLRDISYLKNVLRNLNQDQLQLRKMSEKAREMIIRDFSFDSIKQRLIDLYRYIAGTF